MAWPRLRLSAALAVLAAVLAALAAPSGAVSLGSASSKCTAKFGQECVAPATCVEGGTEGSASLVRRSAGLCPGTSVCCFREWTALLERLNGMSATDMLAALSLIRTEANRNAVAAQVELAGVNRERIRYFVTVANNKLAGRRQVPTPVGDLLATCQVAVAEKFVGAPCTGSSDCCRSAGHTGTPRRSYPPLGSSPANAPYSTSPKAPNSDRVFNDVRRGPSAALNRYTQFDGGASDNEAYRCGTAVVIGVCLASQHVGDCLVSLAEGAKSAALNAEERGYLDRFKAAVTARTVTYGDLGKLSAYLLGAFGAPNSAVAGNPYGMDSESIYRLLEYTHVPPPSHLGNPDVIFSNGRSWPVQLAVGGSTSHNHWAVAGKLSDGKVFFWDPLPIAGKPQVSVRGSGPAYDAYMNNIQSVCSGCGYAPISD